MNAQARKKPMHVYIGRSNCGCCTCVISDLGDKDTADSVADVIKSGRTIDRVAWDRYVEEITNEPTFLDCPHEPMAWEE